MAKINRLAGPSNADVAKETALLTKQGKIDVTSGTKIREWLDWKAS